jgi:hypothetical protein
MAERSGGALRTREAPWTRLATYGVKPGSQSVNQSKPTRASDIEFEQASRALHNLRGVAIAFVVALHAAVAYLASNRASPYPFDSAPYGWLAFPIIDRERSLGFDIFCAWQDVYLMALWFFLAGAFAWRSLAHQSIGRFLGKRLLRLGVPLAFGLAVVMPAALYPVYLVGAASPSLAGYAREYLALPFLPVGPMWFLWVLLALTALAALLRAFPPSRLPLPSYWFNARPGSAAAVWCLIVVGAYAPLALAFTPSRWIAEGPVAVQLCRPLLYSVYFLAGLWGGAEGLGRGLLQAAGPIARNWKAWAIAAVLSLLVWLGLMGLVVRFGEATPFPVTVAVDIAYPVAGAYSALFALAFCLRFGAVSRWSLIGPLSDNSLGIYVLHYAPVIWLQYALLGLVWPAPLKAAVVFCGAIACCLALIVAGRLAGRVIEDGAVQHSHAWRRTQNRRHEEPAVADGTCHSDEVEADSGDRLSS